MVWQSFNKINANKSELRRFGVIQACALAVIGGVLLWRGNGAWVYLFIAAGVILVCGLAYPNILKPIYKFIMLITKLIGWLLTKIILIVLFYGAVLPVGIIARLFGKEFLDLKLDRQRRSYWIAKKNQQLQKEDYLKQF